jgi:molybdopterin synthase catalytic subunit
MIRITSEPFDAADELRNFLLTAGEGAAASFVGIVRGEGRVDALTLDHYPGFTEKQIASIVGRLIDRHRLAAAVVVHRYGTMKAGDTILFAATAAPRRRAALDALDQLVEQLKTDAPFWKKELRGGIEHWLEPDHASAGGLSHRTSA